MEEQRNRLLEKDLGMRREMLEHILKKIALRETIVISGVRRSGKSVLLRQIVRHTNSFKETGFFYINFDDERLDGFALKDFNALWEEFLITGMPKNSVFAFVDEIQEIKGWEKWVSRMYEFENVKFFITGSNARLLSSEISTVLTGRNLTYQIFPFSFKEIVNANNLKASNDTKEIAMIKSLFRDYLEFGGFPEVWLKKEKELLSGYYNDIINRDITERYKIKNKKLFREFISYIISCYGKYITYHKLKNVFNLKSVNTAKKYFGFAEEAFLIYSLESYSSALAEIVKAPRKCFVIDHGLADYLSLKSGESLSSRYENIVFIELKRMQSLNQSMQAYYWKNAQGHEVDFLVKEGNAVKQLIQVCYSISDQKTKDREIRAILKASQELKCNNLLILTEDYEAEEDAEWFGMKGKIVFVPLWKWLLLER